MRPNTVGKVGKPWHTAENEKLVLPIDGYTIQSSSSSGKERCSGHFGTSNLCCAFCGCIKCAAEACPKLLHGLAYQPSRQRLTVTYQILPTSCGNDF